MRSLWCSAASLCTEFDWKKLVLPHQWMSRNTLNRLLHDCYFTINCGDSDPEHLAIVHVLPGEDAEKTRMPNHSYLGLWPRKDPPLESLYAVLGFDLLRYRTVVRPPHIRQILET